MAAAFTAAALTLLLLAACGTTATATNVDLAPAQVEPGPLWKADAELPIEQEWSAWSAMDLSRLSRVHTPRFQGSYAYRIVLKDGDDSYGERAEVGTGNGTLFPAKTRSQNLFHEGDERWIFVQTYLPDEFPIDTTSWNVVHQIKPRGDGGPVIAMEVRGGRWQLNAVAESRRRSNRQITRWTAPAVRHRWVSFVYHVLFSPKSDTGYVELFGDLQDGQGMRLLMPRLVTHTMKFEGDSYDVIPNIARIGIYRDPATVGDAVIYHDGYTVYATRPSDMAALQNGAGGAVRRGNGAVGSPAESPGSGPSTPASPSEPAAGSPASRRRWAVVSAGSVRLRRGTVGLRVRCAGAQSAPVSGRLRLRTVARYASVRRRERMPLGSRAFRCARSGRSVVTVRLSRRAQALVRRLRRVRVEARASTVTRGGVEQLTTARLTLLSAPTRR